MCKFDPKNNSRRIDPCMIWTISFLKEHKIKTLGCCCGHYKYYPSIIIKKGKFNFDLLSGVVIPRKKKFYRKDKKGIYYIPEVEEY